MVQADDIHIKTAPEVAATFGEMRAIDRGFLPNWIAASLVLLFLVGLLVRPLVSLLFLGVLALDFAWFVTRRLRVLHDYDLGQPRLITASDFATVSAAYERAGVQEPSMTDWEAAAGHASHEEWRKDLRYRKLLEAYRGGTVADVGCGDGRLCWRYKICAPDLYWGIDVSRGLLRVLEDRTGGEAHTSWGTAENLGLASDSVDFLACTEVFEHLQDPASAMREFARVVKVGGRIVIQTPNAARLRNFNLFHIVCCVLGRFLPRLLIRQVLHENTFVRAYTYHWDFTRQDFNSYVKTGRLIVENIGGATYRFNPNGSTLHRALYWLFRLPFVHWFGWDITVILQKA